MAVEIRINISGKSTIKGELDDTAKGLDKVAVSADKADGHVGGFFSNMLAAAGGFLAANVIGGIVNQFGNLAKGMIAGNAEFETYETQFGVLLGSADEAKKRLGELAKFGASTPFELPELVRADKVLTSFGIHSQDMLAIVGDVAAGTGSSFEEMALLMGKFSAGATGEALARFQELGIATKDELAKMGIEFNKAGAMTTPVAEAMPILENLMREKFGGMMEAQSQTFSGMLSNLQDWVGSTLRTVGQPIFEVLKGQLSGLLAFLGSPEAQGVMTSFASALAGGIGAAMTFLSNEVIPALMGAWNALQPVIGMVAGLFSGAGTAAGGLGGVLGDLRAAFAAVWSTAQTQIAPILANLGTALFPLVGAAIQVLAGFWNDVLKPALITSWNIFTTLILPVLASVAAWLAVNLPPAIQTVTTFLTGTLFPALHTVYDFINVNVVPILASLVTWLQTNIPPAVQTVANFWNTVLQPALQTVWAFIQGSIIPIISTLINSTFTTLNTKTQEVANFWNTVLKPALSAVWGFLNTYVIPLFTALANVTIALVKKEVELLAAVWTNVLKPAFNAVWSFVQTYLTPVLTWLYDTVLKNIKEGMHDIGFFILGTLAPQLQSLAAIVNTATGPALDTLSGIADSVAGAIGDIGDAVKDVIGWLNDMASTINSISIPDWLEGHSPPPMADWFRDIGLAAREAGLIGVPAFNGGLASAAPSARAIAGAQQTSNITNVTLNYSGIHQSEGDVTTALRVWQMLYG